MKERPFSDFFTKHKKSIIISILLILIVALLGALYLTESLETILKDLGIGRDEYYAETVENDNPSCSFKRIEYPENAFSIGVPNGWYYAVESGTVSIMEDETNTTAVLIYTAKLQQELTKEDFLNTFSKILKETAEEGGGTFEMQEIQEVEESEDEIYADVIAQINEYDIKGKMHVSKTKDFVTFKVYWAPAEIFEERESFLKEISGCFARTKVLTDDILAAKPKEEVEKETPEGFKRYKGKYFQLDIPSDFKVDREQKNSIDLVRSDQRTVFTYTYTTELKGEYTPRSWVEEMFSQIKEIKDVTLTDGEVLPSQILGYSVQEFNLSGSMQGTPLVAKITVGVYQPPYSEYRSAFAIGQMSTTEIWENVKDNLQKMQDSLTFVDSSIIRKNTLLPIVDPTENLRAPITVQSSAYQKGLVTESSEKWVEGMRGYETLSSPSTDLAYQVPINSWSLYGPEGSGYYRQLADGTFEKLQ